MLQRQADDTELSFTERAMLIGIAVKWFSNQKPPGELEELQKKRWLFKIRAEIEKDYKVWISELNYQKRCCSETKNQLETNMS